MSACCLANVVVFCAQRPGTAEGSSGCVLPRDSGSLQLLVPSSLQLPVASYQPTQELWGTGLDTQTSKYFKLGKINRPPPPPPLQESWFTRQLKCRCTLSTPNLVRMRAFPSCTHCWNISILTVFDRKSLKYFLSFQNNVSSILTK